jgi:hypothetical protein
VDKDDWKSFFRFLDEANEGELQRKLENVRLTLTKVSSADIRSDLRRMQRLLDQEIVIRLGLSSRSAGDR